VDLSLILGQLPKNTNPELLVGTETFDDAGVLRLDAERALVMTVDLITPVSNNPFIFGQVAAANSLSDVFAMGGSVVSALNICCFPEDLPTTVMTEILKGARNKLDECGAVLMGGHTVEDSDLKFGLSVTGFVHPDRILRNVGAKPGDALILTKPLGTGVGISAEKMSLMDVPHHDELMTNMAALNRAAAELASSFEARAVTDVTGFGLAGHGFEMANGSGVRLRFQHSKLPIYPWFERYWSEGARTKVTSANQRLLGDKLKLPKGCVDVDIDLYCDPQTSGGLLISLAAEKTDEFIAALKEAGLTTAVRIGEVTDESPAVEFVS
jgi:selenide, water dikinase